MRSIGTKSGKSSGVSHNRVDAFVCSDDVVEVRFSVEREGRSAGATRVVSVEGEDALLDLAHQIIGAVVMIRQRQEARARMLDKAFTDAVRKRS